MLLYDDRNYYTNKYALSITKIGPNKTKVFEAICKFASADSLSLKSKKYLEQKRYSMLAKAEIGCLSSRRAIRLVWNPENITIEDIKAKLKEIEKPKKGTLYFNLIPREHFEYYAHPLNYSTKLSRLCDNPLSSAEGSYTWKWSSRSEKECSKENLMGETEIRKIKKYKKEAKNKLEEYYQYHPIVFCSFYRKSPAMKFKNQLEEAGATVKIINKSHLKRDHKKERMQEKKDCIKSELKWEKLTRYQKSFFKGEALLYKDLIARKNFKIGDLVSFTAPVAMPVIIDTLSTPLNVSKYHPQAPWPNITKSWTIKYLGCLTKRNPRRAEINVAISIPIPPKNSQSLKKHFDYHSESRISKIAYHSLCPATKEEKIFLSVDKLSKDN